MKRLITIGAAALGVSAALLPAAATAQTSDNWQFGASLQGFFPSVSGNTNFPPSAATADISVSSDDIIGALKFAFMGSFEARKGRWGAFTDVLYVDLGGSKSGTRDFSIGGVGLPVGAEANAHLDIKGWVWTLAGQYQVMAQPDFETHVFAGARMIDMEQKLEFELTGNVGSIPLSGRSGTREADAKNWDGIVGVRGRYSFGADRAWFVPYYLDVGAGESDLTWQARAGIGYKFKWGETFLTWRYLDYDFGKAIDSLSFSGPELGINLRW